MKTLLVMILILITIEFKLEAQESDKKFYVHELMITKDGAIEYESCYRSKIKIKQKRDQIFIDTDSVHFHAIVLSKKNSKYNNDGGFTLIAAKTDEVFYVREFNHNIVENDKIVGSRYYLVVFPIRLSVNNKNLGGYGLKLIISSEQEVYSSY